MEKKSRTFNSIRNSMVSVINNIMTLLFGFAYRTIFVLVLSKEYLGLNGLFSNILNVLSIAELGIGAAIIYRLYAPVSTNDEHRIVQLMNFYKRVYFVIAMVILVLGCAVMPALPYFIADTSEIPADINIYLIYFLFLMGQVVSYICIHKQSIIIANQQEWIVSTSNLVGQFVRYASMIAVLFATKNFTLVLTTQIVATLLQNIVISLIADHLYPFLRHSKEIIPKEERKEIYKETTALLNHRIGSAVVSSTDNILISSFVGLGILGLYSNYKLIIGAVISLVGQLLTSLTASIGNLYVSESSENTFTVYKRIQYINIFASTFIMLSFCLLINDFIKIWLGAEYVIDMSFVLVITFSNILYLYRNVNWIFVSACGLYMKDKWRPIIEVIVNLTTSILLVKVLGLNGIFIGTIISTVTVPLWREFYILYKNTFKTKKVFIVALCQFLAMCIATLLGVGLYYLFGIFPDGIGWFVLKIVTCIAIIPTAFILLTFRMPEFGYVKTFAKRLLRIKRR